MGNSKSWKAMVSEPNLVVHPQHRQGEDVGEMPNFWRGPDTGRMPVGERESAKPIDCGACLGIMGSDWVINMPWDL